MKTNNSLILARMSVSIKQECILGRQIMRRYRMTEKPQRDHLPDSEV